MTLKFRTKKRSTGTCDHESEITIAVAGMSRSVCESCGRVSVAYVEDHFNPERAQEVEARSVSKD